MFMDAGKVAHNFCDAPGRFILQMIVKFNKVFSRKLNGIWDFLPLFFHS